MRYELKVGMRMPVHDVRIAHQADGGWRGFLLTRLGGVEAGRISGIAILAEAK